MFNKLLVQNQSVMAITDSLSALTNSKICLVGFENSRIQSKFMNVDFAQARNTYLHEGYTKFYET